MGGGAFPHKVGQEDMVRTHRCPFEANLFLGGAYQGPERTVLLSAKMEVPAPSPMTYLS